MEKQMIDYIDFDTLGGRQFGNINEFVKLFTETFDDAIKQLNERGRENIMFSHFEFSHESDWDGDEYSNHRAALTLYFSRDETAGEKERREAYERRTRLEQERKAKENELKMAEDKKLRYEQFLELKAEFENEGK